MSAMLAETRPDEATAVVEAPRRERKRVVIVGGGFAGIAAAHALRHVDAEVVLIDRRNHHIFQPLLYQVVATGMRPSYFGHDEFARYAPGLKSLSDAETMRAKILGAFELAAMTEDEGERARQMTFVLVGAGPTGVELAASMAQL